MISKITKNTHSSRNWATLWRV